jgi:hypothetical protein
VAGTATTLLGVLFGRYVLPAPKPNTAVTPAQGTPKGSARPSGDAFATKMPMIVPSGSSGGTTQPGTSPSPAQAGHSLPGMPTRINEFGIPVGYPHTEAGAISACGNYISAIQEPGNRSKEKIYLTIESIAIISSVELLSEKILNADIELAKKFFVFSINDPNFSFSLRAAGYKTLSSKSDDVTISIWSTSAIGIFGEKNPALSPQEKWGTDICRVLWNDNDWKIFDANDGPAAPPITGREAETIERFTYVGRPTT